MDTIIINYDNIEQSYEEINDYYTEIRNDLDNFNVNLNKKHFITSSTVELEPQKGSVWFRLE